MDDRILKLIAVVNEVVSLDLVLSLYLVLGRLVELVLQEFVAVTE
jgi:hypothetical protein